MKQQGPLLEPSRDNKNPLLSVTLQDLISTILSIHHRLYLSIFRFTSQILYLVKVLYMYFDILLHSCSYVEVFKSWFHLSDIEVIAWGRTIIVSVPTSEAMLLFHLPSHNAVFIITMFGWWLLRICNADAGRGRKLLWTMWNPGFSFQTAKIEFWTSHLLPLIAKSAWWELIMHQFTWIEFTLFLNISYVWIYLVLKC